jgi:hypothetical protein
LQGILVDVDGESVPLSATAFHSVLGQIKDSPRVADAIEKLALAILAEVISR